MKTAILLVIGAVAALAACSGDDFTPAATSSSSSGAGGAAPDTAADCKASCAAKASLGCMGGPANCEQSCTESPSLVDWCADPVVAYQHCLAAEPATSYECKSDGPQPKSDVCTAEYDAAKRCYYEGPEDGALPDLTAECTTVCQRQATLACAIQDCDKTCNDLLDPSKECNGAWAAFVACAAQTSAGNYACDGNNNPSVKLGFCDFEKLLMVGCGLQL